MTLKLTKHVLQNPDLYMDVQDANGVALVKRKPATAEALDQLEALLAKHNTLKVVMFKENYPAGFIKESEWSLPEAAEDEVKPQPVAPAKPHDKTMGEANLDTQLILLQNENKWLKESHHKLERENADLRVFNEKLRIENNDLTVKVATSDKEKELALAHAQVSQKTGLGKIGSPDEIKDLMFGLAEMVRSFKGEPAANQVAGTSGPAVSTLKQEAAQFYTMKLTEISDEQTQKLTWLMKTMIEKDLINKLYDNWTASTQS